MGLPILPLYFFGEKAERRGGVDKTNHIFQIISVISSLAVEEYINASIQWFGHILQFLSVLYVKLRRNRGYQGVSVGQESDFQGGSCSTRNSLSGCQKKETRLSWCELYLEQERAYQGVSVGQEPVYQGVSVGQLPV